jgi:hypothetical protein
MNALRDALVQYVALRRALGSKFQEPAVTLQHFVDFLERESAEVITTELALRWAMEPKGVQRAPDYPHLLPAVQIRTNLAAEMPSLHGSKRDTAALTATHQHRP